MIEMNDGLKSCSNCRYSDKLGRHLCCMGQKYAPFVFPNDLCDAWKPKYISNYERIVGMTKFELAKWIHDQIIDRNIGVPVEDWLKYLEAENGKGGDS